MKKKRPCLLLAVAGKLLPPHLRALLPTNQRKPVNRRLSRQQLNRQLTAVAVVYHLLSVFYND